MDDNNTEREREIEEITAYYEDIPNEEPIPKTDGTVITNEPPEKTEQSEQAEDIPKAEPVSIKPQKNGIDDETKKRLIWALTAVLIIIIGFIIGRFILPVPEGRVMAWKNTLQNKDKEYLAAIKSSEDLNKEIKKLVKESDEIENVFNDLVEYQKSYDKLKKENDEKQQTLSSLKSQLKSLTDSYNSLKSELDSINAKTYTLSPGLYTVGVDIPEGNYSVTGNGSMAVASNNVAKINVSLDGEDYPCTLSEGDIIKLETKAKFVPLGE